MFSSVEVCTSHNISAPEKSRQRTPLRFQPVTRVIQVDRMLSQRATATW